MEPWRLTGRRAVVTGGTSGIGLAVVSTLLERGAEVLVVARNADRLEEKLAVWRRQDRTVYGVSADVGCPDARTRIFEEIDRTWGGLDILVNNVGTNIRKPTRDYTDEELQILMQTNQMSVV